jgi:nicotinamidase-related amidase
VPGAQRLLAACRAAGMRVVHTLEAHKPDLSDLPAAKFRRGCLPPELRIGAASDMGRILIRGEPGNGIIPELAPVAVRVDACSRLLLPPSQATLAMHEIHYPTRPHAGRKGAVQARERRFLCN